VLTKSPGGWPALVRFAGVSSGIGVLVCLVLIAIWKAGVAVGLAHTDEVVSGMMLVLWPASFLLMALHGGSSRNDVMLMYMVLILVNAILYGLVGLAAGALMRITQRSSE
jgi:hypothetical protein